MNLKARIYSGLALLVVAGILTWSGALGLNWPQPEGDTPQRLPRCDTHGEHHVTLRVRLNIVGPVEVVWHAGQNRGSETLRDKRNFDTSSIVPCGTTIDIAAYRDREEIKIQCEIIADSVRVRYRVEAAKDCALAVKLP